MKKNNHKFYFIKIDTWKKNNHKFYFIKFFIYNYKMKKNIIDYIY